MFVIMSYDVSQDRASKALKIARKYLYPVQRSLFQGYLTDKQLLQLQKEIAQFADPDEDKVIFYKSPDCNVPQIDEFGPETELDMIL